MGTATPRLYEFESTPGKRVAAARSLYYFKDGSWLLFRKSGTEPMIRIYAESPKAGRVEELLDIGVAELDRF